MGEVVRRFRIREWHPGARRSPRPAAPPPDPQPLDASRSWESSHPHSSDQGEWRGASRCMDESSRSTGDRSRPGGARGAVPKPVPPVGDPGREMHYELPATSAGRGRPTEVPERPVGRGPPRVWRLRIHGTGSIATRVPGAPVRVGRVALSLRAVCGGASPANADWLTGNRQAGTRSVTVRAVGQLPGAADGLAVGWRG